MEIKPIRTESDYKAALREIETLANSEPGTHEFDRLDVLATLVEAYEAKICPIAPPDPVVAIHFALERLELSPRDLEPYIGTSERVQAILTYQQRLTLPMIHRLSGLLGVPVAILAQPYPLERGSRRRASASASAPVSV